jgi:antitoxin (DNA-binding transcriptional repressor) of toxin-antitoxin stability system
VDRAGAGRCAGGQTRLSELLRFVEAGLEVEIARGSVPVARLVPLASAHHSPAGLPRERRLGTDIGRFVVPDDFDHPLPDDEVAGFGH